MVNISTLGKLNEAFNAAIWILNEDEVNKISCVLLAAADRAEKEAEKERLEHGQTN